MNRKSTIPGEQLQRDFMRFLRRVRRRAWTILVIRCGTPVAVICTLLCIITLIHFTLDARRASGGALATSAFIAAYLVIRRRSFVNEYIEAVDRRYDAAGRIIAAAEFVSTGESLDAFQRLAVEDAALWLQKHRRRKLPWTVRMKSKTAAAASLALVVASIAGCEAPQPAAREPASEPEAPPSYPVANTAQTSKTHGDNKDTESGDSGAGRPSRSSSRGSGQSSGQSTGPSTTSGECRSGGAGASPSTTPSKAPPPTPVDLPEPAPSPGSKAGHEEGPKAEDQQEVEAPEEEIRARAVDDDSPAAKEEIVEDVGEGFTEGAPPPPATQPIEPVNYRDARQQDLTRERVSPARRALIERYFKKLNQRKRGLTSRPASRPATRPARKDQNDE